MDIQLYHNHKKNTTIKSLKNNEIQFWHICRDKRDDQCVCKKCYNFILNENELKELNLNIV